VRCVAAKGVCVRLDDTAHPRGAGGGKPLPYDAGARGTVVGRRVVTERCVRLDDAAHPRGAGGGKPLPYDAGAHAEASVDALLERGQKRFRDTLHLAVGHLGEDGQGQDFLRRFLGLGE
jgi:hypothetical protein